MLLLGSLFFVYKDREKEEAVSDLKKSAQQPMAP